MFIEYGGIELCKLCVIDGMFYFVHSDGSILGFPSEKAVGKLCLGSSSLEEKFIEVNCDCCETDEGDDGDGGECDESIYLYGEQPSIHGELGHKYL